MDSILHALRHSRRSLTSRPGFTFVAVTTLALGIGANTTVFSVVDAVLFRSIPFPDPDRLVMVWETVPARNQDEAFIAFPNYRDYREGAGSFEDMAAFFASPNQDVNLTGGLTPERVNVARVTSSYFDVLGVAPSLGRAFTADEDQEGNHRVAILSNRLWTRQFGADPEMIGRPVHVNGFPYTVVGIMPADFRPVGSMALGEEVEMWRPLAAGADQQNTRTWRNLRVVGRLRPDANMETAAQEIAAISDRIEEEDPTSQRGRSTRLVTLHEQSVGSVRQSLMLVWGAVALVLLIACANVANLLLVESGGRAREMSIRASLGASRGRIVALLMAENGMLALLGGAAGVGLAWIGVTLVRGFAASNTPLLDRATVDLRVLAFTIGIAGATGLVFGLVPALHAGKADLTRALKEAGAGSTRSGWGTARGFIVTQLALAMVLMVGSGLLIRSFTALRAVDPGFEPGGLLTLQMELPMVTKYPSQDERERFFEELRTRLGQLPGVTSAANAWSVPMGERGSSSTFWIEGRPEPSPENRPAADMQAVSPEYFRTMGIPVLRGRGVERTDARDAPRVLLVNQTMVDRYFSEQDPIGAEIQVDGVYPARVVGVVGDVLSAGLATEPRPAIYYAADQLGYNFMTVVIRTQGAPRQVLPAVREQVAALDPELPLHNVRTMDELLERNVGGQEFTVRLLSGFALLALVLAAVGTYGVMASALERRKRELGIRLALGAEPKDAFRLIVTQGAKLIGAGIGLGLVAAGLLSKAAETLLFGVSRLDPWAYAVTALVLGAVAMSAVTLTGARAARTDPVEPLKAD
jgi:putative ABC transport system permease protein